ncbi:oxygen-independent coproporphyrinogen III oxidase [Sulfurimonas gotlandica GD1]|uniref:Heme chaperone HemW n=1 Tax=Sulfurimonas gotlandica (strain DSM 19862 / JCM 16533 / GD1) TaxID=929558 RepID=B6BIN5_SULGG|nr:radical SAM family heme chaperone HemW [Sulfurimonas gotlandica]EDZ63826.1 putative oxygen-independent coproporphyrinogen III oxidase [Sulfurimonas gotlandica GD1]EHP30392.1 oxygen-independent coproporphyrinogen III oxidase [Sulfurimonas gotlandica GD1]
MLLYIHIPFCDSKCSYCAFNSYVDKFHLKEQYMDALLAQLDFELKRFDASSKSIESVFIGGGTPSTVSPQLYKPIFELIKPYLQNHIEITSEANPNSATKTWLQGMFDLGVNRISFGVQSFNDKKLKLLNRAHNVQDAKKAILNAHNIGYKNLSLDLIYATLGDTKELLQNDLKTAFSLPINHLSAYALTIEEGTPFESKPYMSKETLELTNWIFETIITSGFKQYEISNFGTYKSTHNTGYWEYKDYIGLGSGAVGKLGLQRFYPTSVVEDYIKNPFDIKVEDLTIEDKKIEQIFLGLRSFIGVETSILNSKEQKRADILVDENKLYFENATFYNYDYLLADEIALFLTS